MERVAEKLEMLFFTPGNFFTSLKNEKGYIRPIIYFALIYLLYVFLANITTLIFQASGGMLAQALVVFPVKLLIAAMGAFALPFFASSVVHLGFIIIAGNVDFFDTFRVVTYAGIIFVVYMAIIQLLNIVFLILSLNEQVSQLFLSLLYSLLFLATVFGGAVHHIIAEVIGLSMYHKVSQLKAFLGVILVPLILSVFGALVIISGSAVIYSILSSQTGMFISPL